MLFSAFQQEPLCDITSVWQERPNEPAPLNNSVGPSRRAGCWAGVVVRVEQHPWGRRWEKVVEAFLGLEEGYSCTSLPEEDEILIYGHWGRPADLWDEPPNLTGVIVPSQGSEHQAEQDMALTSSTDPVRPELVGLLLASCSMMLHWVGHKRRVFQEVGTLKAWRWECPGNEL